MYVPSPPYFVQNAKLFLLTCAAEIFHLLSLRKWMDKLMKFCCCNFVVLLLKMIFSEILMPSFSCCVGKRFYFEDDFSLTQRFFLFCSVGKIGVSAGIYLLIPLTYDLAGWFGTKKTLILETRVLLEFVGLLPKLHSIFRITPNSTRFFVTLILLSKKQHISKRAILCKTNRSHNTLFPTSEFCFVFRMKKRGMQQKSIIISQKLHGKVVAKCTNFNLVFCYVCCFFAVF